MKNVIATRHLVVVATAAVVLAQVACSSRTEVKPAARTTLAAAQCKPDSLSADQTTAAALINKLHDEGVEVGTVTAAAPAATQAPSVQPDASPAPVTEAPASVAGSTAAATATVTQASPVIAVSPTDNLPAQSVTDLASLGKVAQRLSTAYTVNCTATGSKYVLSNSEIQNWKAMTSTINDVLAKYPTASPSPAPASADGLTLQSPTVDAQVESAN